MIKRREYKPSSAKQLKGMGTVQLIEKLKDITIQNRVLEKEIANTNVEVSELVAQMVVMQKERQPCTIDFNNGVNELSELLVKLNAEYDSVMIDYKRLREKAKGLKVESDALLAENDLINIFIDKKKAEIKMKPKVLAVSISMSLIAFGLLVGAIKSGNTVAIVTTVGIAIVALVLIYDHYSPRSIVDNNYGG